MSALLRCLSLITFFAFTGFAGAETRQTFFGFGSGEVTRLSEYYNHEFHDLLDDAGAPRAQRLGADAVRFSSQPELGGTGYIILLNADGRAEVTWFYGHPRSGWRRTHRARLQVSEGEYRGVVAEVDRLLAEGIADPEQREGETGDVIVECTDGPGYLTERVSNGHVIWFRPQCSGANSQIADYLTSWAFARIGS